MKDDKTEVRTVTATHCMCIARVVNVSLISQIGNENSSNSECEVSVSLAIPMRHETCRTGFESAGLHLPSAQPIPTINNIA